MKTKIPFFSKIAVKFSIGFIPKSQYRLKKLAFSGMLKVSSKFGKFVLGISSKVDIPSKISYPHLLMMSAKFFWVSLVVLDVLKKVQNYFYLTQLISW